MSQIVRTRCGAAILITAVVALHGSPARADEIYLKSGKILKGSIYKEDSTHYYIKLGNKKIRVPRDKAEKVVMEGTSTSPEEEYEVIEETGPTNSPSTTELLLLEQQRRDEERRREEERKQSYWRYENEKKSVGGAFALELLLPSVGLFYTGSWGWALAELGGMAAGLILISNESCDSRSGCTNPDEDAGIATILISRGVGIVAAPLLASSHNDELRHKYGVALAPILGKETYAVVATVRY